MAHQMAMLPLCDLHDVRAFVKITVPILRGLLDSRDRRLPVGNVPDDTAFLERRLRLPEECDPVLYKPIDKPRNWPTNGLGRLR